MAEAGFAPKLLYYGKIGVGTEEMPWYGDLQMVVMEYVDGMTVHRAPQLPSNFCKELTKAIEYCHRKGFVFGDLRKPNVMITQDDKVQLIDFDWAGCEGKVTYPVFISPDIVWPKGVQGLEPILQQHDREMIRFMCPREVKATVEEAAKDNAAREKQSASPEEHEQSTMQVKNTIRDSDDEITKKRKIAEHAENEEEAMEETH
ncbi:hypothetical protein DFH29DRAFT_946507 [Suillus ampliporus]|nr:hypothetical protein DFH29DRAFT_946507 [Suillus ampliporus]